MSQKTNIPDIIFRYSFIYDWIWKINLEKEMKDFHYPEEKEVREYIQDIEKKWQKKEQDILQEIVKITEHQWKQDRIICYVVGRVFPFVAFSDPLTMSLFSDKEKFIDVLVHEIIHRFLFFNKEINRNFIEKKYLKESRITKIHILVHAIHKHIYLSFFDQERLDQDIKNARKKEDYKRAWDIVEKEGYKKIINKAKQSL